MKTPTVQSRLTSLPKKVALPFQRLLENEQLDDDTLSLVLDAGELSGQVHSLLGFAVACQSLERRKVPVFDTIRMSREHNRRVRLDWSAARWEDEHAKLSRAATLQRLSAERMDYDMSAYTSILPTAFSGYLIRSSRRLGCEGLRQRHCVASYHDYIRQGRCAIAVVFVDRRRWTVELRLTGRPERPLIAIQVKTRFNERASPLTLQRINDILGIPAPPESKAVRSAESADSNTVAILNVQAVLPVLRDHAISQVRITFDGSGDSGSIDEVEFTPTISDAVANTPIECHSAEQVLGEDGWTKTFRKVPMTLTEALRAVADDYLEATDVDWYNNDGGFGELVIDVDEGTLFVEVNTRYTSTELAHSSKLDIASGESMDE